MPDRTVRQRSGAHNRTQGGVDAHSNAKQNTTEHDIIERGREERIMCKV